MVMRNCSVMVLGCVEWSRIWERVSPKTSSTSSPHDVGYVRHCAIWMTGLALSIRCLDIRFVLV